MGRDDKQEIAAWWLTAAPSAGCKLSVDVGDRATDRQRDKNGHRRRVKPPYVGRVGLIDCTVNDGTCWLLRSLLSKTSNVVERLCRRNWRLCSFFQTTLQAVVADDDCMVVSTTQCELYQHNDHGCFKTNMHLSVKTSYDGNSLWLTHSEFQDN